MTTRDGPKHLALRALRERLHLTQDAAAAGVGVERGVWNKWENLRQGVSAQSAQKIAAKYGGSPSDYITITTDFSAAMLGQLVEVLEKNPGSVDAVRPLLQELVNALYGFAERLEAVLEDDRASQTPPSG